jgi:hypothetical protein
MALCTEPVLVAVVSGACVPDVLALKIMASPVAPLSWVYPDVVGAP